MDKAVMLVMVLSGCSAGQTPTESKARAVSEGLGNTTLTRLDTPWVEGVTLLMTQFPDAVVVDEAVRGAVGVDLDPLVDDREGFRTRLLDDAGRELWARTTPTPVLVRDYLQRYSELAGVDLLAFFADLGAFHVRVPLLPGGATAVFEIRDEDGVFREMGTFNMTRVPTNPPAPPDNVTGWTTLHEGGPSEAALDLTLVGDGYTEADQDKWQSDAAALADALLSRPPLSRFSGRINVHRLDALSVESGASYDCVGECRVRDTAFRSFFALNFVNDLLGTDYRDGPIFQLGQHDLNRALSVVPTDLAIVLVNTELRGGMSIHHASVATGGDDWIDTGVHEAGHLIGLLGDEYIGDECIRSESMGLPRNIAADPTDPPWPQWIDVTTPLPTPSTNDNDQVVGAFETAFNCEDLYRPTLQCRMRGGVDTPFCPVCSEQLVLQLTRHADIVWPELALAEDGAWLYLNTLGLDAQVRVSEDAVSWTEVTSPIWVPADSADLWVEVALETPLVRVVDPMMVETLHFGWRDRSTDQDGVVE